MDLKAIGDPFNCSYVRHKWLHRPMGLEGSTGQSCPFRKLGLLWPPDLIENRGLIVPGTRWVGRDPDGMSWMDCMPMIGDQGVQIRKGTREREFRGTPTWYNRKQWWLKKAFVSILNAICFRVGNFSNQDETFQKCPTNSSLSQQVHSIKLGIFQQTPPHLAAKKIKFSTH